jgi:hypothetical protein
MRPIRKNVLEVIAVRKLSFYPTVEVFVKIINNIGISFGPKAL